MAQRRMFNKSVTNSDNFLEMPDSSQNLYFHLSMNADDDGFVDNWKSIMRMTGHKEDDLKVLITKQYVIPFESGVIVIRHWRLNNYLRNDRFTPSNYKEEMGKLTLDDNNVYQMETNGIPNGNPDKIRLDKIRLDYKKENIIKEKSYFDNENVNSIFDEFLQLRKKLKAVNSDRAITLLINQLNKYDDETKIKMIEQSILNSWKSVYEIKDKKSDPQWFDKHLEKEIIGEQDQKELESLLNELEK